MREWMKQAERDAGTGDGGLTSDERRELGRVAAPQAALTPKNLPNAEVTYPEPDRAALAC